MWLWLIVNGCSATAETGSAPPAPPPAPVHPALLPDPQLPAGCVATIAELPAHDLYAGDDPRLQGDALVVVLKEARRSMLFVEGQLATTEGGPACWRIALASPYSTGHKQQMGDMRTPEGWWRTSDRPWSSFSHALTVDYPGVPDARRGLQRGWISPDTHDAIVSAHAAGTLPPMETRLGGKILLHGGGSGADWTLGCVAYDDDDILALRAQLPEDLRTDVLILP